MESGSAEDFSIVGFPCLSPVRRVGAANSGILGRAPSSSRKLKGTPDRRIAVSFGTDPSRVILDFVTAEAEAEATAHAVVTKERPPIGEKFKVNIAA